VSSFYSNVNGPLYGEDPTGADRRQQAKNLQAGASGSDAAYDNDDAFLRRSSFAGMDATGMDPTGSDQHHMERTNANANADDIEAFRRQMGWAPVVRPPQNPVQLPPRPQNFGARRYDSVSSNDSFLSSDDSSSERSMSDVSTQTRTDSGDFRFNNPIALLNAGSTAPSGTGKSRGFFKKLWSFVRGKGFR